MAFFYKFLPLFLIQNQIKYYCRLKTIKTENGHIQVYEPYPGIFITPKFEKPKVNKKHEEKMKKEFLEREERRKRK